MGYEYGYWKFMGRSVSRGSRRRENFVLIGVYGEKCVVWVKKGKFCFDRSLWGEVWRVGQEEGEAGFIPLTLSQLTIISTQIVARLCRSALCYGIV